MDYITTGLIPDKATETGEAETTTVSSTTICRFDGSEVELEEMSTEERLAELTELAKMKKPDLRDLSIGESAYVLGVRHAISLYREGAVDKDELTQMHSELKEELVRYWMFESIDRLHVRIRNKYSHILTEAEKNGCEICRRLVKIFDGRISS